MGKFLYCLLIFIVPVQVTYSQSHGLEFSSHEVVPEKRTSLDLTPDEPVCLHNISEVSFDLMLRPNMETYFGYVMRMLTSNHQNIDLVYNQRLAVFNFVIGETITGTVAMDTTRDFGHWQKVRFRFDEKKGEASFYYNNKHISTGKIDLQKAPCGRIFFGTTSFEGVQTLDIPPMRVKDVRLTEDGKLKRYYPLSESKGAEARDEVEQKVAKVKNPVWVKPRHQNWEKVSDFITNGAPSTAFDRKNEVLYIITTDSLYRYSLKNMVLDSGAYAKSKGILPDGNQSIYDNQQGKLYNFYIDEKKVSTFDPVARTWDVPFTFTELTEFWQANKFLSPLDSSLYILCGYGQLRYKNMVQRFHFPTRQWSTVVTKGDTLMPRYLAAVSTNKTNDTAFIMGGYGSNTGDQAVNPKYNYELVAYSIKDQTFKLRYRLPEPPRQFCFANSLVLDEDNRDFYGLIYPTDQFNSSLQLIRGSLDKPGYTLLGDSIPYSFYDIRSFADLFYSPVSQKLIAVTIYHTKENISNVKIFTLDFPPNPTEPRTNAGAGSPPYYWLYIVGMLTVGAIVVVLLWMKKKKPSQPMLMSSSNEDLAHSPDTSAMYLFGQFEVFDKSGNDITKQFTPLLKELFLLLLIHSIKDGKGIAAEELYEKLWDDKSPKDARNNFSVNIVKLKAVLEKVGGFHIGREESGKWKLDVLRESVYIDYQQYLQLTGNHSPISHAFINHLLDLVHRGSFLRTTHYEWLDPVKFDISVQATDLMLKYISKADLHAEAEFMVKITNAIFHFDALNEEALVYKCRALTHLGRHSMARDTYEKFAKEYKESYGQDFGKSFMEITQH